MTADQATTTWAANWRVATEHRDRVWAEDRWAALVRNCEAARRRHLHAAETARHKQAVTSGDGWRLLDRPHEELEKFAHDVWNLAFHGIPWPKGWRVRWGDLRGLHAFGLCAKRPQLILIDERAQHGRAPKDLLQTVLHELVHLVHPDENHGAGFEETLQRVVAYVLEPTEPPMAAERPHPTPAAGRPSRHELVALVNETKGRRWRPGGFLDPELEYRG